MIYALCVTLAQFEEYLIAIHGKLTTTHAYLQLG